MNRDLKMHIATKLLDLAEFIIDGDFTKVAWSEEQLYQDIRRAKDLVIYENYEVEDAMGLIFGKGFKTKYPGFWDAIKNYITEFVNLEWTLQKNKMRR